MKTRSIWLLLILLSVAALAAVLIPAWLIQPFKRQTLEILEYAYILRRWSPLLTLVILAAASFLAVLIWKRVPRLWQKAGVMLLVLVNLASAWFARQNHFEWMFKPLPKAGYVSAGNTDFVEPGDMVLSVRIGGECAAYPIRLLAYHHLVQDVVGGKPIVATY